LLITVSAQNSAGVKHLARIAARELPCRRPDAVTSISHAAPRFALFPAWPAESMLDGLGSRLMLLRRSRAGGIHRAPRASSCSRMTFPCCARDKPLLCAETSSSRRTSQVAQLIPARQSWNSSDVSLTAYSIAAVASAASALALRLRASLHRFYCGCVALLRTPRCSLATVRDRLRL